MALSFDPTDEEVLSIESQRSLPAPFLTKTYQLVDDPSSSHIVSWGEDGTTFIVWRPAEFARDLLPNYFKHNNFSSFVRQLNTYGFRKIVLDRWEFANGFFRKGERQLLSEIQRRKASQQVCTSRPSSTVAMAEQAWSSLSSSHSSHEAIVCRQALIALSDENERLGRDNAMLAYELSHLKKLYTDVVFFIQQHVGLPSQHACKLRRLVDPSKPGVVAARAWKSDMEESSEESFRMALALPPRHEHPTSCMDGMERELPTQTSSRVTAAEDETAALPKLFGVSLHGGRKRRVVDGVVDEGAASTASLVMNGKLESIKSPTTLNNMDHHHHHHHLPLELTPPPLKTPWLKLCSPLSST